MNSTDVTLHVAGEFNKDNRTKADLFDIDRFHDYLMFIYK